MSTRSGRRARIERRLALVAAVTTGLLFGVGAFTVQYASGLSYLSNDPAACANCHVMDDHYASWLKASHRTAATCNDCHIPHEQPGKLLVKMRNGWNHSVAFTTQRFPEPIRITDANLEALQDNCVDCHATLVSDIDARRGTGEAERCTVCHGDVGHLGL